MPAVPFSVSRDHVAGFLQSGSTPWFVPAVSMVGSDGAEVGVLPAGTDRSGSATTTSVQIVPANTNRRGLEIQNIGANNIGVNEFGGVAAIGTAGTYTVAPGASMKVRTNRAVTAIAATVTTPFTATEW